MAFDLLDGEGSNMAAAVYALCAVSSAACAVLLFAVCWAYRSRASRLVLWCGIAFTLFAVSNALVFADFVVLPSSQLAVARAATACLGAGTLLVGLICETE